jgi:hypothetical protein
MQPNQYNNQYQHWQGQQPTGTNYQTNAYYATNNNPYGTQQIPQQQYMQQPMNTTQMPMIQQQHPQQQMYYNTMQQPTNTTQMPYQQNMNQMYTQNQNPTQTQQIQPPFNSLHSNDPYNVMYHQHGLQQYGSMGTNSPAPSSPAPTPESDPEIEKLRKEIEDIKKTRQQRKLEEHLNYLSVQETNAPQQTMKIEPVRDTRSQSVSVTGLRRTVTSAPQAFNQEVPLRRSTSSIPPKQPVQSTGPKISEYRSATLPREEDEQIFNTSDRSNIILIRKFDYDPKEFESTMGGCNLTEQQFSDIMQRGNVMTYVAREGTVHKIHFCLHKSEKFLLYGNRKVDLRQVWSLHRGQTTDTFVNAQTLVHDRAHMSFSIIMSDMTVDVVADSPLQFELWTQGLIMFIKRAKSYWNASTTRLYEKLWIELQKEKVPMKEVYDLLPRLFINPKLVDFTTAFSQVDQDEDGLINSVEFCMLMKRLRARNELYPIFQRYASNKVTLSAKDFQKFLREEQKEVMRTLDNVMALIQSIKSRPEHAHEKRSREHANELLFDEFDSYLASRENSVFDPECDSVYHDMTRPLSHYFIQTSFNVNTSNQKGLKMFSKPLRMGVRCLEVDLYDGKEAPEVVCSGVKLPLTEVLKTIKDLAFVASEYPVILSLDIHCSSLQQLQAARAIKSTFGAMLAIPPADTTLVADLPSPEDLKYSIILRCTTMTNTTTENEAAELSKEKSEEIIKDLKDLIYLRVINWKGFDDKTTNYLVSPMISYSVVQTKVPKLFKYHAADFVIKNRTQTGKVFPMGVRNYDANYDPMQAWSCGFQCVAINTEINGEESWIAAAKFLDNGQCGYVLKPPVMMDVERFDPNCPDRWANPHSNIKSLTVEIISARELPKPHDRKTYVQYGHEEEEFSKSATPFNGYVTASIYGAPGDSKEFKTHAVADNRFNPLWQESFTFDMKFSELDVLLLRVMSSTKLKTQRVAHYAIPVRCIRPGYRVLKLCSDKTGATIPWSDLLCKFHLEVR